MKFTFDDPGQGGLRTIGHLPDGRLIRLQGRNGVGKTVSMRLLALCAGADNPWVDERQSWRSLVRLLPDGYTIEGFDGHRNITWKLFPRRDHWPEELPDLDPELARVRQSAARGWSPPVEVRIDGVLRDAAQPLEVKLLSGREGLLEVWTQQVRAEERRFDRLASRARAEIGELREAFGHLQQAWDDADPDRLARAVRRVTDLRDELTKRRATLQTEEREARLAQLRQQRRQRLSKAEEEVPRLDEQISRSVERLAELQATRDGLTRELAEAASGGGLPPKEQEELDRALRNEENRREAHSRAARQLVALLEKEELEGIRRSDVGRALRETRREIRTRENDIAQIRTDEPVLDLATQLHSTIRDHPAPGGARLLDAASLEATVSETQAGLTGRIESLRAAGPLDRLEKELESLRRRAALLAQVVEAERVLQQKSKLVDEVSAAQARRRKQNEQINDLATRQEEIEGTIEDEQETLVDLRDRRRNLLGDADDLDELREAVESDRKAGDGIFSEDELDELRRGVAQLSTELEEATRQEERVQDAAVAAKHVLDEYGLDRNRDGSPLGTADEVIAQLQVHLDLGRSSFGRLQEVLTDQRPSDPSSFSDTTVRLAERYASIWAANLSSDAFQNELFEGGRLIEIDLLDGHFTWADRGGRTRRRPIQALSSGQMVYAYTKAIIADLDSPAADDHRVIVLDEFAAYLDEHAQAQLVNDLREYVQANERTQIVMVLPRDPGNEAGWVAEVLQ